MLAANTLADTTSAPPVNIAVGELMVVVPLPDVVLLELIAAQVLKFWPPRNTPTVCASVMCIMCSSPAAKVAFVAQKLMVKLKAVAARLHVGVAVVPS